MPSVVLAQLGMRRPCSHPAARVPALVGCQCTAGSGGSRLCSLQLCTHTWGCWWLLPHCVHWDQTLQQPEQSPAVLLSLRAAERGVVEFPQLPLLLHL